MQDRISVHGVLLDNKVNHLRNFVHLDDYQNRVFFTTWRSFDTEDPLDAVLAFDTVMPFSIASGKTDSDWDSRTDHGNVNLFLNLKPVTEAAPLHEINKKPSLD